MLVSMVSLKGDDFYKTDTPAFATFLALAIISGLFIPSAFSTCYLNAGSKTLLVCIAQNPNCLLPNVEEGDDKSRRAYECSLKLTQLINEQYQDKRDEEMLEEFPQLAKVMDDSENEKTRLVARG